MKPYVIAFVVGVCLSFYAGLTRGKNSCTMAIPASTLTYNESLAQIRPLPCPTLPKRQEPFYDEFQRRSEDEYRAMRQNQEFERMLRDSEKRIADQRQMDELSGAYHRQ